MARNIGLLFYWNYKKKNSDTRYNYIQRLIRKIKFSWKLQLSFSRDSFRHYFMFPIPTLMYHRCRRWHKVATPIKITPFSRLERGLFFFFVIRVQHDISKGNVLITRILFHKQIEQRRCSPKSGSRSPFPCPCSCLSRPAAKIINTFYTTQVHVARNTSMKRKKSVDFKSRSWSSRGYDHSLSYILT